MYLDPQDWCTVKDVPVILFLLFNEVCPFSGDDCGGGELEDSYDEQYLEEEGSLQYEEYSQGLLHQADDGTSGIHIVYNTGTYTFKICFNKHCCGSASIIMRIWIRYPKNVHMDPDPRG